MIVNLLTNPCCNKANRCQLCSSHQKKGSIKCETGKWEAVVTNDSIGTCSSDLYIHYFFETSGTASCGTTGITTTTTPPAAAATATATAIAAIGLLACLPFACLCACF